MSLKNNEKILKKIMKQIIANNEKIMKKTMNLRYPLFFIICHYSKKNNEK
jgi:hypothetical protein